MEDSIDQVISKLQQGDSVVSREIYHRFADRIRVFAKRKLDRRLNGKVSAEDVVQSVFRSFFRRNSEGQFTFDSWNSLWALLVTMASRKCYQKHKKFSYAKRDLNREDSLFRSRLA